MRLTYQNIFLLIVGLCSIYQLLVVKIDAPFIVHCSMQVVELLYDISLALLVGVIVYFFTSVWKSFSIKKEAYKIIENELKAFITYSLGRFKVIEENHLKSNDFRSKETMYSKLKYGVKSNPKANASNTIHQSLIKIESRKQRLFKSAIPLIQQSNNLSLLNDVYKLLNHKIFKSDNKYLNKEEDVLKNEEIGISKSIVQFEKELNKFKEKHKLDD